MDHIPECNARLASGAAELKHSQKALIFARVEVAFMSVQASNIIDFASGPRPLP